ncbi:MAG: hypothetical protein J6M30_08055 [Bacteroidales bacterium]|nr:hypothetical protein [Bacteroidales bacterium]
MKLLSQGAKFKTQGAAKNSKRATENYENAKRKRERKNVFSKKITQNIVSIEKSCNFAL